MQLLLDRAGKTPLRPALACLPGAGTSLRSHEPRLLHAGDKALPSYDGGQQQHRAPAGTGPASPAQCAQEAVLEGEPPAGCGIMALLHRIFSRKAASSSVPSSRGTGEGAAFSCSEFDLNCIRLIVYQDCERRGRQVLFDSKAVREIKDETTQGEGEEAPTRTKPCQTSSSGTCTISSCFTASGCAQPAKEPLPKYQYTKPASDVNMLGEMMFGSVAMSYKGSTLKIHFIRCPPQLMISKVFSAKVGGFSGSTHTLQDSLENINHDGTGVKLGVSQSGQGPCQSGSNLGVLQMCGSKLLPAMFEARSLRLIRSASFFAAHSTPVDMPSRGQNEDKDSGIARSASLSSLLLTPLPSPSTSISSNCASSYQRRWWRSQTTSLEKGVVPRWPTDETFSMADETYTSNPATIGRKKIAISVLFSLSEEEETQWSFQDFFFSHFPLFESHMNKLKSAIEKAMISCRKITESSQRVQIYLSQVMEALAQFRKTIWDLYCAPRITEPLWLTMTSNSSEKGLLCQHFLRELTSLTEQLNKNQFFAALITAVLTYHLAWVPTVMPNDHPPIKSFSEKHTSQSVNLLAQSHPYNPLWAQLGDLYGAIGSPVRMARTVVVGKRKDLVQRILYILTYFIRCSELEENHLVRNRVLKKGERLVQGSNVTTSLEKGEVEDSEYVIVTLNNESALVSPSLPCNSGVASLQSSSGDESSDISLYNMNKSDGCFSADRETLASSSELDSGTTLSFAGTCKETTTHVKEAKVETIVSVTRSPSYNVEEVVTPVSTTSHSKSLHSGSTYETEACASVKLTDWAKAVMHANMTEDHSPTDKVTFTMGYSHSPNLENCSKTLDEHVNLFLQEPEQSSPSTNCSLDPPRRRKRCARLPSCEGGSSIFDEYFVEGNSIETNTVEVLPSHTLLSDKCFVSNAATKSRTCKTDLPDAAQARSGMRPLPIAPQHVPCGDPDRRMEVRVEGDIPRNESCDSALGQSEYEFNAGQTLENWDHNNHYAEVDIPLPRSEVISSPSIKNFGRSLFGGYCSTYMPDMVLHGIGSTEKLKPCLTTSLAHSTNHPVMDEPLAEAVCIVADTDKLSVQVVSSQKTTVDNLKLGTDVLVSSQVCSLLQSILQLYKLKTPPEFCVMHLEDKLQEFYFKSKMLSEYLRGHKRVHVKELSVVLGIESNDLPLLAAVASTHSPHVAQILL
ncbi:folliculin-interacting protein 2 isoform X2 [Pseudophryne corroboree]|uniref:folliculin-interacting protein 2 isoform X2 n=1 Tax=Pseudophryne corroboree TaxID=495146 RepID=UPI003082019E